VYLLCFFEVIVTKDPEDKEENNLCLSPNEDVSPDSASDISLRMEKKKSFKFSYRFASPLTTPRNKTPIYNETFIDLASTGLVSLPIKIIRKYFTIRVRIFKILKIENAVRTSCLKSRYIRL